MNHDTSCHEEVTKNILKELDELQCPWPADIWTMTTEEYVKAVPDPHLRTAISGLLMRHGWELAIMNVKKMIREGE